MLSIRFHALLVLVQYCGSSFDFGSIFDSMFHGALTLAGERRRDSDIKATEIFAKQWLLIYI